jgi:hypothetical protein
MGEVGISMRREKYYKRHYYISGSRSNSGRGSMVDYGKVYGK